MSGNGSKFVGVTYSEFLEYLTDIESHVCPIKDRNIGKDEPLTQRLILIFEDSVNLDRVDKSTYAKLETDQEKLKFILRHIYAYRVAMVDDWYEEVKIQRRNNNLCGLTIIMVIVLIVGSMVGWSVTEISEPIQSQVMDIKIEKMCEACNRAGTQFDGVRCTISLGDLDKTRYEVIRKKQEKGEDLSCMDCQGLNSFFNYTLGACDGLNVEYIYQNNCVGSTKLNYVCKQLEAITNYNCLKIPEDRMCELAGILSHDSDKILHVKKFVLESKRQIPDIIPDIDVSQIGSDVVENFRMVIARLQEIGGMVRTLFGMLIVFFVLVGVVLITQVVKTVLFWYKIAKSTKRGITRALTRIESKA